MPAIHISPFHFSDVVPVTGVLYRGRPAFLLVWLFLLLSGPLPAFRMLGLDPRTIWLLTAEEQAMRLWVSPGAWTALLPMSVRAHTLSGQKTSLHRRT